MSKFQTDVERRFSLAWNLTAKVLSFFQLRKYFSIKMCFYRFKLPKNDVTIWRLCLLWLLPEWIIATPFLQIFGENRRKILGKFQKIFQSNLRLGTIDIR